MSDVGRNAPCPCGSGKKYKKCCFGEYETATRAQTGTTPYDDTSEYTPYPDEYDAENVWEDDADETQDGDEPEEDADETQVGD